jgi:YD repeat-containing protein
MDWHSAIAQVVRWGFVSPPDAATPSGEAEQTIGARRVGYDDRGRPVIVGPAQVTLERWGHADPENVRTTFDATGRPVSTGYRGTEQGQKRYVWDDTGRLVEIHEDHSILSTTMAGSRVDVSGRLTVEHDVAGPLRIVDDAVCARSPARRSRGPRKRAGATASVPRPRCSR